MIRTGLRIAALLLVVLATAAAQFPKTKLGKGRIKGDQALQFLDRLDRMDPKDRAKALDRMPPARRRLVERNLAEYKRLSPDERERRRKNFDNFQNLSEGRREALRKVYKKFNEFPEDRRPDLRREMSFLSQLPAGERQERIASEKFKSRFNTAELALFNDLSAALDESEPVEP